MRLFILQGDNMCNAQLVTAREVGIELERHMESLLENNPDALVQDEFILWIGKQASATSEHSTIYPDLLGLDAEGNLVIVELKRDQAPREVVAQLLEYAAWATELDDQQIAAIATDYFQTRDELQGRSLKEVFTETFEVDEVPPLNRRLRLFVVARDIPPAISGVCRFLSKHRIDINCVTISVFQTESGKQIVGIEGGGTPSSPASNSPSNPRPRSELVREAVEELTGGNTNFEFTVENVIERVSENNPDCPPNTVRGRMIADTVNNPARRRFGTTNDYYWQVRRGVYRLYDPEQDEVQEDNA